MVASSSYSYSEIIVGNTSNAAQGQYDWSMANVLPQETGLTVNAIIYQYTTVKQQQDDLTVSIENKDALGTGLIFQQVDDWSGLPGNTIRKAVPVDGIPIQRWGDGSISTEGVGTVVNPTIVYTYRYDTCDDPINDPRCPGYAAAMAEFLKQYGLTTPVAEIEDPLNDTVKDVLDNKTELAKEEKSDEDNEKEKEKEKKRKELGIAAARDTVMSSEAIAQEAMLQAMNNVPNFESYVSMTISGGVYADALQYAQTRVPENKKALRVGLAQQILHDQMVEIQYNRSN